MSEKIATLNDASFDEHVKSSDVPVLVDFWAEWCGPCKMIAPVLEEIAAEQDGKLEVAKLNIDDNLDMTRRFDVMSIPTLILFKDGEPARGSSGPRARVNCSRSCPPTSERVADGAGPRRPPAGRARGGVDDPGREIPLGVGDEGAAVADVQQRLDDLGFSAGVDPAGFVPGRDPGRRRGLPVPSRPPGRRGLRPQTWSALVEAGRRLGDRFLYRRTPMLRGDDVAELQQRLSALGFDRAGGRDLR